MSGPTRSSTASAPLTREDRYLNLALKGLIDQMKAGKNPTHDQIAAFRQKADAATEAGRKQALTMMKKLCPPGAPSNPLYCSQGGKKLIGQLNQSVAEHAGIFKYIKPGQGVTTGAATFVLPTEDGLGTQPGPLHGNDMAHEITLPDGELPPNDE